MTLYDFDEQVARQYVKERLLENRRQHPNSEKEPRQIKASSVRWEISRIQLAWKWARENARDLKRLENPWKGIEIEGSTSGARERSLEEGELVRLIDACNGCLGDNKYYLALAIYLAVETGMRRQEILLLEWDDIDFAKRRITIRKHKTGKKTGKPGIVVLPLMAQRLLLELWMSPDGADAYWSKEERTRIFRHRKTGVPMTPEAFRQAWDGVIERAKLDEHLTFHDLRREANMRFIRAGLDDKELNIAMRHDPPKEMKMNKVYTNSDQIRNSILEKLDRYTLQGKTEDEWKDAWIASRKSPIFTILPPTKHQD
jgi:integrase